MLISSSDQRSNRQRPCFFLLIYLRLKARQLFAKHDKKQKNNYSVGLEFKYGASQLIKAVIFSSFGCSVHLLRKYRFIHHQIYKSVCLSEKCALTIGLIVML